MGLSSSPGHSADVLDQHEEMAGIGARGYESEMPVERGRILILRVDGKRANAHKIGDL
jgi:hypothetical protein